MSKSHVPSIESQSWHPLLTGSPPQWASGWGEDQYGVFANANTYGVRFCLRWIPLGQFLIGSPESEPGRSDYESPQTQITLAQGYWLMDAPVTQELWEAVMGDNPSRFKSPDRPVEQVSWDEVGEFIARLNKGLTGASLRLPSECEWEYACRAGSEEVTYAGSIQLLGENNAPVLDEIAWYAGNSGIDFELKDGTDSSDWKEKQYDHNLAGTHPVRKKHPNNWGCYDLLGNVFEWCEDVWSGSHDGVDQRGAARRAATGSKEIARVVRGGSWYYDARYVRAAYRDRYVPDYRDDDLGFRCVLGQEESVDRDDRVLDRGKAESRPSVEP